jgi:Tfp pilus assembly protein PilW
MMRLRAVLNRDGRDDGFTLIELLVGLVLTSLVTSTIFTAVMAATRVAKSSRTVNDLNEEARLVMNRMTRELREARVVTSVVNPAGPGGATMDGTGDVSLTFEVDFNGNGVIEPDAADPEVLTYLYDRASQQLVLKAAGQSLPVLAANVADFTVNFTTRRYQYDGVQFTTGAGCTAVNQTKDGIVHWYEVDKYPGSIGNCNGLLDTELSVIDSVQIDLKVLYGPQQQVYRTTVDMRNSAG